MKPNKPSNYHLQLVELYFKQLEKRKDDVLYRIRAIIGRAYIMLTIILPLLSGAVIMCIKTPRVSYWVVIAFLLSISMILFGVFGWRHRNYGSGSSLEELGVYDFLQSLSNPSEEQFIVLEDGYIQAISDIALKYSEEIEAGEKQIDRLLLWQRIYMALFILGGMAMCLYGFIHTWRDQCVDGLFFLTRIK